MSDQHTPVLATSGLSRTEVIALLDTATIPIRLACNTSNGFPLLASLWYRYDSNSGNLYCATQRSSRIAKHLAKDQRIAFEIAADAPPYRGVRGQGTVTLTSENSLAILEQLLDRYAIDQGSTLARWLLSRVDEEVILAIQPSWLTGWDYSERMQSSSNAT